MKNCATCNGSGEIEKMDYNIVCPDCLGKTKTMKKTIPFDIDLARKGARVVTETGQEVEILNYNLGGAGLDGYVLGRYKSDDALGFDYEVWPASGKFADPVGRPPELRIEGGTFEASLAAEDLRDQMIGRLELENESLKARNRELEIINDNLRLDREKSLAGAKAKKQYYKDLEAEVAIYRDQTKAPISIATMIELQKKIDTLERWKKEQIAVWAPVLDYMSQNPGDLTIGDSIAAEVVKRLEAHKALTELDKILSKFIDSLK